MRILVVEDDPRAAKQLTADLTELGHETITTADGRAALAIATDDRFDAILLDVMLPFVDGVGVATMLRERSVDTPILMLTALGDLDDRLAGLDAGADDYLVKPAAPAEIEARIRAILRRANRANDTAIMRLGELEVNEIKHRATRAGRLLILQNLEFKVLCELMRHAEGIVTRQMLYHSVWHFDFEPATNIVDAHISRIRTQLTQPGETEMIKTIRGVGYMLTAG